MSWYDPKEASRVIPEGDYDAVLEGAEHQYSKAGKPMVKMTVRVYAEDSEIVLFDYLVSSQATTWKIAAFASAVGQSEAFKAGKFDPIALIGTNLRVKVGTRTSPEYGEQNQIVGYSLAAPSRKAPQPAAPKRTAAPASKPSADLANTTIDEDDIPF